MKKILNGILSFLKSIFDSFKTNKEGLSGRKISACVAIIIAGFTSIKKVPTTQQFHALIVWLAFALICLGLVTIPELIKFLTEIKNGKQNEKSTNAVPDPNNPVV